MELKDKRRSRPQYLVNQQIPFAKILLAGNKDEGTVAEVISKEKALKKAQQEQKDLVCFHLPNPVKKNLPVCKIIDYQKYLYELEKKPGTKPPALKKVELT